MRKTIIALIILLTLSLGCISSSTTTITTTVEKIQIVTVTEKTTYTITKIVTTTTTVYTRSQQQEAPKTLSIKIHFYGGSKVYTTVNNGTRTVYVPASLTPLENDIYNMYRFLDKNYIEHFSSLIKESLNMPPPPETPLPQSYETIASIMYFSFEYDTERAANPPLESYLPDELLSKRSGVCGDFAMFYMAYLLAHDKTVTFYVLSFNSGIGHAMIEYDGIIFENNIVGEDPKYVFNYWYHESGPYTLYALTVAPAGIIAYSSTTVTTYFSVPLTPIHIKNEIRISGKITYTIGTFTILQLNSLYINTTRGEAWTLLVAKTTISITASYSIPKFYYASNTLTVTTTIHAFSDLPVLLYMVPGYYPFYDVFKANRNTLYMLYWNENNEPVYYTVTVNDHTLYITYTEYYRGIEITGTGTATYT